jgi:DNA-binding response OmpR family regulator
MMSEQTILVVDDHVNLARAFAMALESKGYVVHTAHTAEDGLRLAQAEHPAAIILDLRMPFINGTGFLYRLRALPEHSDTPVMVVTGESVNEEMRGDLADLRAVLRFKPLGMNQLLAEVGALLAHPPGSTSAPGAPGAPGAPAQRLVS